MLRNAFTLLLIALATPLGSARCAVAQSTPDSAPISRVLFGSCIKQDKPMPILSVMAKQAPDLTIMLGDNIYADTTDMKLMTEKYGKLGANLDFQKLRAAAPMLATWDDHDYGVNDGGNDYAQRVQSQEVFNEFWQTPKDSVRRHRPGIYDAASFGPTGSRLQVILLDTRYFRSPLKKGERRVGGPYVADTDPEKTMLGEAQWKWLEEQLKKPADVRLLCTSIQCLAETAGQETWSNLPRERERLFQLIRSTQANGVVMLSGDRHWSELSRVDDAAPYPLYEMTSSSLNQLHGRGTPTDNRFRISDTTFHKENFGVVQIQWQTKQPHITMQIRDMQNSVRIERTIRLADLK